MESSSINSSLFVGLIIFLVGCGQSNEIIHFNDGELRCQSETRNGIKDGETKCFYSSGKIASIKNYRRGVLDGVSEDYFENGNTQLRVIWKSNKVHGFTEQYYPNGNLFIKTHYEDGAKVNLTSYSLDGKISSYDIYNRNGDVIYSMAWAENGEITQGMVVPVVNVTNDTVAIGEVAHVNVSFGYVLTGKIDILFEKLDSLNPPEVDFSRQENEFLFKIKFSDAGRHELVLTPVHTPAAGDTLSANNASRFVNVFVTQLRGS